MKTMPERLKIRMQKNRPMTSISIRLPVDVIDDLKEIAPGLGFSGYQPLIRTYIGQGLRKDLEKLDQQPAQLLAEALRKRGLSDEAIAEVVRETHLKSA